MHKTTYNEYELRYLLHDNIHFTDAIYLHEGLGSIKSWGDLPITLYKQLPINSVLYNRIPHGQTKATLPSKYHYFDFQVEELSNIIDRLNVKSPILIGHSDGATIALLFAAKYPEKAKAIVAIAAHIYSEEKTEQGIAETYIRYSKGNLKEKLERQHGLNTDPVFYKWHNFWSRARKENWNIKSTLANINIPVLAIQGEKDEYATEQHLFDIRDNLPCCQANIISAAGHFPHISHKNQVSSLIRDFLNSHFGI